MTFVTEDLYKIGIILLAYLSILVLIIYIYYNIIFASNDERAYTKNLFTNIFFIVVPVIIIFILIFIISFEPTTTIYFFLGSFFVAVLIGIIIYFLQTNLLKYIFNKYLLYIVIIFILIIGFSIIVTLLSGTLKKLTGWTGFFINLMFYIPCLIRDAVQSAIQEYNTFSITLVILFVLEIILVMMYLFLMPFINNRIFPHTVNLVKKPIMLNKEHPIQVPIDISNNFALSMWTYINPGSINKPGYSIESPIFSFLDSSGNKHIQLTYSNLESNNDFIMYIGEHQFPISQPLQKWNHFVFNYTTYNEAIPGTTISPVPPKKWYEWWYNIPISTIGPSNIITKTTIDMFVNGYLERSFTYDESPPIFSSTLDRMFIGNTGLTETSVITANNGVKGTNGKNSNREGLYGSICNVNYYKQPLTKMAIIYHYNLNIINNPPV